MIRVDLPPSRDVISIWLGETSYAVWDRNVCVPMSASIGMRPAPITQRLNGPARRESDPIFLSNASVCPERRCHLDMAWGNVLRRVGLRTRVSKSPYRHDENACVRISLYVRTLCPNLLVCVGRERVCPRILQH